MNQIAVLYRSHFHALELQLELTKRNIPFSITSGIRFFEQAHIKDATAYLRLVANPRDELAFKRLAQLLPGIAAKGAEKIWKIFSAKLEAGSSKLENQPTAEGISQLPTSNSQPPRLAPALQICAKTVPAKAATAWKQFTDTISQLEDEIVRQSAAKMLRLVIDAGYDDYLKENFANYRTRLEDLEQLAVFAYQFASVEDFLTQLALLTNVEAEGDQAAKSDAEKIRLSTIHQAKGLEFDAVFVIMLCDGLFPSSRSMENEEGEEEERRLFYVAITRAKTELYLSYPLTRASFSNSGGNGMQRPSRFLSEIPRGLLNEWNLRSRYG
jgi:DNA helicase-2/ATP-dependent DNA helicase PcrA